MAPFTRFPPPSTASSNCCETLENSSCRTSASDASVQVNSCSFRDFFSWSFDNVLSANQGIGKSYFFFLKSEFWFSRSKQKRKLAGYNFAGHNEVSQDSEQDDETTFESVAPSERLEEDAPREAVDILGGQHYTVKEEKQYVRETFEKN